MRPFKKIKAGSLQFVLFVGAVIAVLLLTFVLLHQTHMLFDRKSSKQIDVIKYASYGITKAMAQQNLPHDSLRIDFDQDGDIQVSVLKTYWGVFEKYTAVSRFKKNRFVKTALVGGGLSPDFPALYLKDNDRPMIIAGTSKISGDAHLPQQGIRPGTISGEFYQFNRPVYGQIKNSTKTLPPLNKALKDHIQQLSTREIVHQANKTRFSLGLKLTNSFQQPTLYIEGDFMDLSEVELMGNVLIKASQEIVIRANSKLKDVVLVAPSIRITDGFSGALQALASQKIEVGKRVVLEYPSALLVDRGNRPINARQSQPDLSIGSNTMVKGAIAYLDTSEEQTFYPQITLAPEAIVHGEVYCEKNLELKGKILGRVVTDAFVAMENGNVYQNHLYKGIIDSSFLPASFAGLVMGERKTVAKWLY